MTHGNDRWLLAIAGAAGIASASRSLGVGGAKPVSVALICAAALIAIGPVLRLLREQNAPSAGKRGVIVLILACHLVATLYFFPPEDIINDRPVITLDHAVHFYEVERGKKVFWDSFRLHTYDPFFLAGYPGGTVFEIDTNGVSLWCSLLRSIETARSYKLFILIAHLLAALTVYAGCRRLRFRREESALGTLVFLVYWHWGRPYAGDFRFAGMFAYLLVCHLSLYVVGLFRSFLAGERMLRFYVIGPLAFLIHPTAAVLLPVPFIALFLAERGRAMIGGETRPRKALLLGRFFVWCILVLAANAIWLVPLFRYLDIKTASESFFQIDGIRGLLKILVKPGNVPALLLAVLGSIGFGSLVKRKRITEAAVPGAASVFLMFLSAFGTRLPVIDQMEPGRFLVPSFVFMAPLAGSGLSVVLEMLGTVSLWPRGFRLTAAAAEAVLLLCMPACALVESRAFYRHTLSTTLAPEVHGAIEAIKRHADRSGRIMVEDGPAWAYGDSHLPSMIPLFTGIEQIGGPYPFIFIEHGFTTFQTRSTMGVPLGQMPQERLLEYIELYNIRWILTATNDAAAYIDRLPYAEPLWSSKRFALYGVTAPSTGFSSELGVRVEATYDALQVAIPPDTGQGSPSTVLLKYHWDRGLRVRPPCVISPAKRLDDPVPLIMLEPNGAKDITIICFSQGDRKYAESPDDHREPARPQAHARISGRP